MGYEVLELTGSLHLSPKPHTIHVDRSEIRANLIGIDPANVYNLDETALFYELQTAMTIATGPVKGGKDSKKRITIASCCNATGSDKRKPLVIGHAKIPRCFKKWNPNTYVDYRLSLCKKRVSVI